MSSTAISLNPTSDDPRLFSGTEGAVTISPERTSHCQELGFYVVFERGAMSGEVVVETAPFVGFSGRWAEVGRVRWVQEDRAHYVGLTGVYLAVRVRVVDPVVGGLVTVYGTAN